ncbi:MAG: hypothetical protein R3E68_16165 [Burkholderiaceae bacterium]
MTRPQARGLKHPDAAATDHPGFIVACFAGSLHSQPDTPVSIEIAVPDRHMQGWLFREPVDAFVKPYDQQPTAGQDDLAVPKLKKSIGKQQDKDGTGS